MEEDDEAEPVEKERGGGQGGVGRRAGQGDGGGASVQTEVTVTPPTVGSGGIEGWYKVVIPPGGGHSSGNELRVALGERHYVVRAPVGVEEGERFYVRAVASQGVASAGGRGISASDGRAGSEGTSSGKARAREGGEGSLHQQDGGQAGGAAGPSTDLGAAATPAAGDTVQRDEGPPKKGSEDTQ